MKTSPSADAKPSERPARRVFAKLALAVIALLLALCVLEVVLRCLFPLYTAGGVIGLYQYDAELGDRLRPGIHFTRTTDYQEEMHTNRLGTVNFQETFERYERIVFAVGDSYTQGTGLPADASYPFQLDLQLNMHNGVYQPTYGVVNLGLSAYGLEQTLICLRRYAGILGRPDYILFLGCDNDYADDIEFREGDRHRHLTEGNPHWGPWLKPVQWLTVKSEIGKRLKVAIRTVQKRRRLRASKPPTAGQQAPCRAALEEPVLIRLLEAAAELDATLVVSWAALPDDPSPSYQWFKEWARSHNVAFADWHGRVQSVCQVMESLPTLNAHSGGHYRTWVNTMIAASFAEQIRAAERP
ncbi:MAG TPA: SGNH/GDSL hydrolase family protein [Sedimentisphaerales bacterium]|nr:SGNH/GDSL hydrolase family protein [Sedimentisphaerales bacterium]HRS10536.1 SGNH/GDSL hydrolase family protein [Sedimentisphaerales bacterium]HRV47240.1 SGNH/GDSL hydrolase family protein [Sedimentisphaerales bacterium]